jgi:ElaB/YqjD/DUF883 family membrane-anchored ribosome-binding protein
MSKENIFETVDDASHDLESLRADIAKLTATVSDLVRHQAAAAASTAGDVVDKARQKVAETAEDTQARVKSGAVELEKAIERNPLTSIVIALVAGLVVGIFTRAAK